MITVEGIGNTRDGLHPVQVCAAAGQSSTTCCCRCCASCCASCQGCSAAVLGGRAFPPPLVPSLHLCCLQAVLLGALESNWCHIWATCSTPTCSGAPCQGARQPVRLLHSRLCDVYGGAAPLQGAPGTLLVCWHVRCLDSCFFLVASICQAGLDYSCCDETLGCCDTPLHRRPQRRRLRKTWRATCGMRAALTARLCCCWHRLFLACCVLPAVDTGHAVLALLSSLASAHPRLHPPHHNGPFATPTAPAAAAPAIGRSWMPSKPLQRWMQLRTLRRRLRPARRAMEAARQQQQEMGAAAEMAQHQQPMAAAAAGDAVAPPTATPPAAASRSGCAPAQAGPAIALPLESWMQRAAPSPRPASTRGRRMDR